jgi:predicted flap endonuclease-1-like 5' DNA nuclease
MTEFLFANLPLVIVGALVVLAVLWWVIMATRRTRVSLDRRDTLDEGAARAARNAALIDAPPIARASTIPMPPPVPGGNAGVGVAVAAAVEDAQLERAAHEADDLTRIKGLGPKLATTLAELGVTRFAQIAAWNEAEIDRIDAQLGRFQGRIRRDSWVEQARYLAAGDVEAFEQRFGAR